MCQNRVWSSVCRLCVGYLDWSSMTGSYRFYGDSIDGAKSFQVVVGRLKNFTCIASADWGCTTVGYLSCIIGVDCKTVFRNRYYYYGSVGRGFSDSDCYCVVGC